MKDYIVTAKIEVEATSEAEAEELVMGMAFTDDKGKVVDAPVFIEIEEVVEI